MPVGRDVAPIGYRRRSAGAASVAFVDLEGFIGVLGKPLPDFRRPDNSLRRDRIDRARADLDARCHLCRCEGFGVGLASEALRTTGIMSGLFLVRKVNGNVPGVRDLLDRHGLLSPDRYDRGLCRGEPDLRSWPIRRHKTKRPPGGSRFYTSLIILALS